MAHIIMEAEKSPHQQQPAASSHPSAVWRPRRTGGVVLAQGQRPKNYTTLWVPPSPV